MLITYVGHATVEIRVDDSTRLLTDPVVRPRVAHIRRIAPRADVASLRGADAVLISHGHHDHLDPRSLRAVEPRAVVCPPGCARIVRAAGVGRVEELEPGGSIEVGGARIEAVEVEHDGKRHPLAKGSTSLGFVIRGRESAFFAGDTELFAGLENYAGVDVALLPIWGWGPKLGAGHMGPEDAARATALLRPRVVIPIHWGTLAGPGVEWRDDAARPAREFQQFVGRARPRDGGEGPRARRVYAGRELSSLRHLARIRWTSSAPTTGSSPTSRCAGCMMNGRVWGPPSPPWNEISSSKAQASSRSGS